MSQFNNKSFKKLKAKWYKKLEDSGFDDAETEKGRLKISAREVLRTKVADTKQSKEDYYALADSFLHEHTFDSELSKVIWEYHTNGLGAPAIADTLMKAGMAKTNRTKVDTTINELRDIMKQKYLKVGK